MPKVRQVKIVNGVSLYQCSGCSRFLPEEMYFKKSSVKTGLTSQCRECIGEYDGLRLEIRRYYMRDYREQNRERIRENQKRWERNNPDTAKRYCKQNKDRLKLYYRKWFEKHFETPEAKEKYRQNTLRYRTRKKKAPATLTAEEWLQCLEFFDYKDAYTGKPMNSVSQDHIIPLKNGGGYTKQNIVPCENSINKSKNDRDMEEWYRQQPFFMERLLKRIIKWMNTP